MEQAIPTQRNNVNNKQYSLLQIIGIWLAAGVPMWVLGWLVYPAVAEGKDMADAGMWRLGLMTLGLVWQFVLSMIILYREEGNIRISTIRRRIIDPLPGSDRRG